MKRRNDFMKRKTTTKRLNSAINNNLVIVQKAELYHKDSGKTDIITDSFAEDLAFLCETIFASCVSWHYEKDYKTNSYITECGRTEGNAENIITVHLCTGDGVIDGDLEKVLVVEETEE